MLVDTIVDMSNIAQVYHAVTARHSETFCGTI